MNVFVLIGVLVILVIIPPQVFAPSYSDFFSIDSHWNRISPQEDDIYFKAYAEKKIRDRDDGTFFVGRLTVADNPNMSDIEKLNFLVNSKEEMADMFSLIDAQVICLNNKQAYMMHFTHLSGGIPTTEWNVIVRDGDHVWFLVGNTIKPTKFTSDIINMINSFTLKDTTNTCVQAPLSQADRTQQLGNAYSIFVDDIPSWATYASQALLIATDWWKEPNPDLEFYVAEDRTSADFSIQWVKDFGGEQHIGYAYARHFVEVGLGDSNCGDKWQPFSENFLSKIIYHEIGHVFGHEHSSDPNSLMYAIAQNKEYGLVEKEFVITENIVQFVPFCTTQNVAAFDFQVISENPSSILDVFVVPSANEFDNYADGKSFRYYSDSGCFNKNQPSFSGHCEGVGGDSGVLVYLKGESSGDLTKITIIQEEKPSRFNTLQKTSETLPEFLESEGVIGQTIPSWVKNNAKWWADGLIGDSDFVSGIQYLIKEGMISVSPDVKRKSGDSIPLWVRNNAAWWADGQITDNDFLKGIEYLVEQGIILA